MSRAPRERSRFVAAVARRGRFLVAEPLFEPGPQVALSGGERVTAGRMALVEPRRGGGHVVRALGLPERAADVVEALLLDRGFERGFRDRVEDEAAAAVSDPPGASVRRRDLTGLPTFTVDPATARDFDDAVSAEAQGDALRLWIHIADVAAHVRPGTALDREAYARATSTYVPGTAEPMLPRALSEDACSLSPGAERLAVTAEVALSGNGEVRSAAFYRSSVRSDARLNYDQLDEIFAGRSRPADEVAKPLELARRAAAALAGRRRIGSLEVESFEPEFEFDSAGDVVRAHSVPQTEAHKLIEHLMILTNERVAELLERRKVPTLYRVHEQPDPQRIERLCEQLAALGVPTPPVPDTISPSEAGALANEASRLVAAEARRRGHGAAPLGSLVLRSLKQAYYSDRNLGHAGLGSSAYAHFTSPIRRYPDLVAHRALLATLSAGEAAPDPSEVRDAGPHCSTREREATRIERDADDVCAAFLLERELFESGWERDFEGEVSGLVGGGAFVRFAGELADVFEGFMPARLISREYFDLDETETALVGRRSGRTIRLGDPVTVRVRGVEAPRGRVDLSPSAEPEEGRQRAGAAHATGGRRG
jgi:ribonuclease R